MNKVLQLLQPFNPRDEFIPKNVYNNTGNIFFEY